MVEQEAHMCQEESSVWYLQEIIYATENQVVICNNKNIQLPQKMIILCTKHTLFIFHDGKVYEAPNTVKK